MPADKEISDGHVQPRVRRLQLFPKVFSANNEMIAVAYRGLYFTERINGNTAFPASKRTVEEKHVDRNQKCTASFDDHLSLREQTGENVDNYFAVSDTSMRFRFALKYACVLFCCFFTIGD